MDKALVFGTKYTRLRIKTSYVQSDSDAKDISRPAAYAITTKLTRGRARPYVLTFKWGWLCAQLLPSRHFARVV